MIVNKFLFSILHDIISVSITEGYSPSLFLKWEKLAQEKIFALVKT